MATLDGVAASLQSAVAELDQAAATTTEAGTTLDAISGVLAAIGHNSSTTAAARQHVTDYLTAIAALRTKSENLRQRVLAIGQADTTSAGGSGRVVPPAVVDPAAAKRQARARKVDDILIAAGLDPKDVYGKDRTDSPGRTNLIKSLLDNPFPGKVKARLQGWAFGFAQRSAPKGDAAAFARRYEYAKAIYDDEKRRVDRANERGSLQLKPGQTIKSAAADRVLARDLDAMFAADTRTARGLTRQPVIIDASATGKAQVGQVQQAADRVGFTDEAAAAYHARKHGHVLPDSERASDVVTDYHHSARRTIRHGSCTDQDIMGGGQTRLVFTRDITGAGGATAPIRAIVYVRPTGHTTLATYTQITGGPRE